MRSPASAWSQQFLPEMDPADVPDQVPRYNIAPTQPILAVVRESMGDPRRLTNLRWGLIPTWARDLKIGNRMINARSETLDSKPSFRGLLTTRRCLIPTDGYYEWKSATGGKQPYLFEPAAGGLLAMAGLWTENSNLSMDGRPIRTCTIITTSANTTASEVHDRMPVFLAPSVYDHWLDPGCRNPTELKSLLGPAPEDLLKLTAVSRRVNSVKHDDAGCVEPA